MKIICAGLLKTGTKSISEALRVLGYKNVHDHFEQFVLDYDIWDKVYKNTATLKDLKEAFKDVDAVMESPACAFWEQLLEAFPEARVILMVRSSEEEWFESLQQECVYESKRILPRRLPSMTYFWDNLIGPTYRKHKDFINKYHSLAVGQRLTQGTMSELITKYRYRQHNAYVKLRCPKEQLLVYNVSEGWEPLCKFLGKPIPKIPFPRKNIKNAVLDEMIASTYKYDCGLSWQLKSELIIRLIVLIVFVVFLILVLIYFL